MRKLKTIDIKGKQYVTVAERLLAFNETYLDGYIRTEIIKIENGMVIVQARVTPDRANNDRTFIAHSQASFNDSSLVNKTSALENAETSAVGRALGLMGIGVIDSIASGDEINKANATKTNKATQKQKDYLISLISHNAGELPDVYARENGFDFNTLTFEKASELITKLKGEDGESYTDHLKDIKDTSTNF